MGKIIDTISEALKDMTPSSNCPVCGKKVHASDYRPVISQVTNPHQSKVQPYTFYCGDCNKTWTGRGK